MTNSYTITICSPDTGATLVTATAKIDASGTHLTEVRSEANSDELIPEELAHIDFPFLVRTAIMLTGQYRDRTALHDKFSTANSRSSSVAIATPEPEDASLERHATQKNTDKALPTRRRSAPDDFGVTYWRLGSIAKVARHYEVPNHIAQDWIKSLQQQGKLANPWPTKKNRPMRST